MVDVNCNSLWMAKIFVFIFGILCQHFITCYICNDMYFKIVNFQICPKRCAECSLLYSCLQCESTPSGSSCRSICRLECDMLLISNGTVLKHCYREKVGKGCCISCPPYNLCSECVQISSGPCLRCKNNSYDALTNCDKKCGHCLPNTDNEVLCDIDTGHCQNNCLDGFYGQRCDRKCNRNCFDSQTKIIKCARYTGKCIYGCIAGRYNETCQSSCSKYCLDENCDQSSGACKECLPGWYGDTCDSKCSEMCAYMACDQTSGSCLKGCIPGRYGNHCEKICSPNCVNNTCHQISGNCEGGCLNGWTGKKCEKPCSHKCFNRTCKQILSYCETGCVPGSYGNYCNKECSGTCLDKMCEKSKGECLLGCVSGWFGSLCNSSCSKACLNYSCNQTTGVCDKGCIAGYHGKYCKKNCSEVHIEKTCENYTVPCLSCESDYENGIVIANKNESTKENSEEKLTMFGLAGLVFVLFCFILLYFISRRNRIHEEEMVMSGRNIKTESVYDEIGDVYDTVSGEAFTTDVERIPSHEFREREADKPRKENTDVSTFEDTIYAEAYTELNTITLRPTKQRPSLSLGEYETPISRSQITFDLTCETYNETNDNYIEEFIRPILTQSKLLYSVQDKNDPHSKLYFEAITNKTDKSRDVSMGTNEHRDSVFYIHAVN